MPVSSTAATTMLKITSPNIATVIPVRKRCWTGNASASRATTAPPRARAPAQRASPARTSRLEARIRIAPSTSETPGHEEQVHRARQRPQPPEPEQHVDRQQPVRRAARRPPASSAADPPRAPPSPSRHEQRPDQRRQPEDRQDHADPGRQGVPRAGRQRRSCRSPAASSSAPTTSGRTLLREAWRLRQVADRRHDRHPADPPGARRDAHHRDDRAQAVRQHQADRLDAAASARSRSRSARPRSSRSARPPPPTPDRTPTAAATRS